MTDKTHISIRITPQRRTNLDALAEIAHTDGDTATIDFALSYTLSALARKESTMDEHSKKVEDNLDAGLWYKVPWSGVIVNAYREDPDYEFPERFALSFTPDGWPVQEIKHFATVEVLISEMREVQSDLRKWKIRTD